MKTKQENASSEMPLDIKTDIKMAFDFIPKVKDMGANNNNANGNNKAN